jgi:RNA polymerase sigma factor (sigma-70 family)
MAVHSLSKLVENLRRTMIPQEVVASDGQLLGQFIAEEDGTAFTALVQRHGPMVWGVCRRIAAHHQDAEDAFQATFLVLARKAASVRPREMLANWLFGVARRTALKTRSTAGKRHSRERQVETMPEPEALEPPCWAELESLLDEELANLPDKYRTAVVLCDLECRKGKDVARQLKVPEGTLASRLRTGRIMLARRLVRRGVVLSGGALATILSQNAAPACVPVGLESSTIQAAVRSATGGTGAETVSSDAAALTNWTLKSMLLAKLKAILTTLLVVGTVALGGGVALRQANGARPPCDSKSPRGGEAGHAASPSTRSKGDENRNPVAPPVEEPAQRKKEQAQNVTYAVADLVMPISGLDPAAASNDKAANKTKEDWLIRKITATVSPKSWEDSGGTGSIRYSARDKSLVVANTPRVQAQVRYLLETMRRVQDVQVSIETHIISLSAATHRNLQGLLPQLKGGHAVLSQGEAFALLRKAQDAADTTVGPAPRVTLIPGQRVGVKLNPVEIVGAKPTELKFSALVAANLQDIEFEVWARVGKADFAKAIRLQDGATLAELQADGDRYLVLMATPSVLISLGEEPETGPANAPQPVSPPLDKSTKK